MIRNVALRSMEGFHCIGGDCEDTCCQLWWHITIDQGSYARLKKAMRGEPLFERTFQLLPPAERNKETFAYVPEALSGNCPMLTDDKLCTLHARWGEPLLPVVCATYPRQVASVGGRLELSGALSCPEVARRALLQPNGAELVEITQEAMGEPRRQRTLLPMTPYKEAFDGIRGTLFHLFGLGEYPLASRLYFALTFADAIGSFFRSDAERIDEERMGRELALLDEPAVRDQLHERLSAQEGQGPIATSLLGHALALRLTLHRVERTLELLNGVFGEYAATGGARADGENWILSPEPLYASFRARWERLQTQAGERVDRWLTNYCQHHAMHSWYTDYPTLGSYLRLLALKVALLRFMLAGHPRVREALDAGDGERLDAACIQVVYILSRAWDHSPSFLEALSKTLSEKMGPQDAVALLKM
jgi:lysine-N-methylase